MVFGVGECLDEMPFVSAEVEVDLVGNEELCIFACSTPLACSRGTGLERRRGRRGGLDALGTVERRPLHVVSIELCVTVPELSEVGREGMTCVGAAPASDVIASVVAATTVGDEGTANGCTFSVCVTPVQ